MEISIKSFGYAVKFDVLKKKEKIYEFSVNVPFFGTVGLRKISGPPQ